MREKDNFIKVTCIIAGLLSLLYVAKVIQDGFFIATVLVIVGNLLYIPAAIIFGKKSFIYWSIGYGLVLVFLIANYNSYLFNNYTALFPIFIAMLLKPQLKNTLFFVYVIAATGAFIFDGESIINFLIHITRSAWIIYLLEYFISSKFTRKALDLTEDEKKILDELNEKKLLKACTCFSKNTITAKLKEARERNKIDTNAELLAEYNLMIKK